MNDDGFGWMDTLTRDELREESRLLEATINSSITGLKAAQKRLSSR